MNKIERVTRALRGEEVDRPPFSFWYHFGLQHEHGPRHAEAEIAFYRAYDLDFLKVMNDYPYPLPDGIDAMDSPEDWRRLEPLAATDPCWAEQLTALTMIGDQIGNEALFVDTIFSPWTTARRLTRTGDLAFVRQQHPDVLLAAMDTIATSLAAYARTAVSHGAAGIFLSLGAANDETMSRDEYEIWGRPFDLRILEAVRNAPFNVLHIHGKRIHFDSLIDYPAAAVNWSHFATAPTLAEGRLRSGKAVMGGIDEAQAAHLAPPAIEEQIEASLKAAGTRGLLITPGCSVPTDTPMRTLRAVKTALDR